MIKHDMEEEDLLKSFKAITQQMQQKKQPVSKANGTRSVVAPSPSSAPTGSKWTFDALAENIKAALHINPINTGAIKDILSLPFKDQFVLLGAITERYSRKREYAAVSGTASNAGSIVDCSVRMRLQTIATTRLKLS